MQGFSRTIVSMRVAHLLMQETGTYNPLYQRSYHTDLNNGTLGAIVDRVNEFGNGKISGALLAGVAGNMLSPSPTPGNEINIPNGWGERRIRFMMEVHCEFSVGAFMVYYLQGYTSYPGVSMSGAVADDMEFIINSIIGVSRIQQMTPVGVQTRDSICESSQILADNQWVSPYQTAGTKYLMRPQDVFTGMHSAYLQHGYGVLEDNGFTDARSMMRTEAVRSSRSNNVPTNFVAKVIDGYTTGNSLQQYGQSDQDIIAAARQHTTEDNLSENPVIRKLSEFRGMGISNRFTFNEFQHLDPGIRQVTDFVVLAAPYRAQLHSAGQTAFWQGSDMDTVAATVLSQAVPAIMMELLLSKVSFRSTNHDIGGQMNTVIVDAKSMTTADLTRHYEIFISRVQREVLYDLTFGNQEPFMLEMTIDMFGETMINLSFGANPMTCFVTPSFCDNLYVPVIAGTKEEYGVLVHDFDQLVNTVVDSVNNAPSQLDYNNLV